MDAPEFPEFRPGNVLATSFTATLTERCGDPVERVPVPHRLVDWLAANGLAVDSCTAEQLALARELREAIHAAATAVALGEALPSPAVRVINERSVQGRAAAVLTPEGERRWQLGPASPESATAESASAESASVESASVEDALSVIAADAIHIVSGVRDGKMALCASPTCRAAFFDTSQSRSRRWCEMNTCGNRQKKARFQAKRRKGSAPAT